MTKDQKDTLEWALRYHAAGWPIFPCRNKQPLSAALEAWEYSWANVRDADNITEKTIRWWWKRFPDAQIAVACGIKAGITVIDIDWLKDPITRVPNCDRGELPSQLMMRWCRSMTSITGSGGRHVFCKFVDVPNSCKTTHPQIDIRSEGGYVILPPSVHENGRKYVWDTLFSWSAKGSENMSEFPRELIRPQMIATNDRKKWRSIIHGVNQGSRNVSATALAGKLIRTFDEHSAWELLHAWNLQKNTPPLPEKELRKTFFSILRRDYARYPRGN